MGANVSETKNGGTFFMIPIDHSEIETNLTWEDLEKVVAAVKRGEVAWIPVEGVLFKESGSGQFDYKGARFSLNIVDCEGSLMRAFFV